MTIRTLEPLLESQRIELIECFKNNKSIISYTGRVFGLDLEPALKIVEPIIDSVLGQGTWEVSGGNFFSTSTGYRVHADTGKDGFNNIWQTFVFPLELEVVPGAILDPDKIRLLILNQTWAGPAAFFLRGSPDEPSEYNDVIKEYSKVGDRDTSGTIDKVLLGQCSHLHPANFVGLSVDRNIAWLPGVPITFPRNRLHVSSDFTKHGVLKKLGLSIFTSKK